MAAAEPLVPEPGNAGGEATQRGTVARDAVVLIVTTEFLGQQLLLLSHGLVSMDTTPARNGLQTPAQATRERRVTDAEYHISVTPYPK